MKWIEKIVLHSANSYHHEEIRKVLDQLDLTVADERPKGMSIFRRVRLDNEWVIQINWESDLNENTIKKSTLGLQMVESLQKLGLINHDLWVKEIDCLPKGVEI
jgi:hypothetical protein